MGRLTDVVKHLIIINVIVFVLFHFIMGQYRGYLYLHPNEVNFQPYQIVSHMFMHGSVQHILFNMFSLFFLGPMVEQALGAKKFFTFYMICGFGALALHLALVYFGFLSPRTALVGASGAVVGVFIAFGLLFPNMKLMLIFLPVPVKAKYMVLAFIAFDLFSGIGGITGVMDTGIAHFAHLGGAITGFILMAMWKKVSFLR